MTSRGGGEPKRQQGKRAPAKKGSLTEEDRELWQTLARSVEPLQQKKPRVPETERSGLDRVTPRVETGIAAVDPSRVPRLAGVLPQVPRTPAPSPPPPLAPFDRKRSRRIATGRIEIEARLDLHGARQAEAYGRFRSFLVDCASRGLATVLVVTGKGGPRPEKESQAAGYGTDAPERGVLRRSVPMWLEEPELRLLVASYTTAGIKHGGGGAIYIHLRKRKAR